MKKWTVMLIPQGLGNTRSLNLYAFQLWLIVGLIAALTFSTTYLLQRYRFSQARADEVERAARRQLTEEGVSAPQDASLIDAERLAIEQKYREEYKASLEAITTKLSELYDLEDQVRKAHGLPPKVKSSTDYVKGVTNVGSGKGGRPTDLTETPESGDDELMRPSHWIYGMANPSADLIVQEINLRKESLQELLRATEEQRDRFERMPSVWPATHRRRAISSRFGNRRDPFTRKIEHHDGLDISAPSGSPAIATARGKVIESHYDRWLGNLVKIDHGYGITTLHGHLSKRLVEKGDQVERFDTIGLVGSTGRSTGPHIHYEVRKNGKLVDPEGYLGN